MKRFVTILCAGLLCVEMVKAQTTDANRLLAKPTEAFTQWQKRTGEEPPDFSKMKSWASLPPLLELALRQNLWVNRIRNRVFRVGFSEA